MAWAALQSLFLGVRGVHTGHRVLHGRPLTPPFPAGLATLHLGLGCFWGAERRFWGLPGVHVTAVGYAGGRALAPSYKEVWCSFILGSVVTECCCRSVAARRDMPRSCLLCLMRRSFLSRAFLQVLGLIE